jgi:hypothetical protein
VKVSFDCWLWILGAAPAVSSQVSSVYRNTGVDSSLTLLCSASLAKKNKYAKNDQEFIRAGRQETEVLTEEEKLQKRQEEKEKKNQPVKKAKNPGRGVEGKFVYAMQNVYKFVNGDRAILDNISLSFFEGYAKTYLVRLLDC